MDFNDFQLLTEPFTDKNDIYLDDAPVDSLLYRINSSGKSTPADVIIQWAEGYPLTAPMREALITILINKISIAVSLNRVKEAESILINELKKVKSYPAEYIKLLVTLIRLNEKPDLVAAKNYYVRAKKLISRYKDVVDERTMSRWNLLSGNGNFNVNPYLLRSRALEMVEKQQYSEAEKIYREMIDFDFELPGTLCHLARVQLLSGKESEAEKSVRKAWLLRSRALKYVVPRIIFFKILFLMIRNRNYSLWVTRLEEELQKPDSFMEWHIQPLLESLKLRLTTENHQVLVTLTDSLQFKDPKNLKGFLFS